MADLPSETHGPGGTVASGERSAAVGRDNHGTINTGVIIKIRGDDIEKNLGVARTILAATLLAPPVDPERKKKAVALPGHREDADRGGRGIAPGHGSARQVRRDVELCP